MNELADACRRAISLILTMDSDLVEIVLLSLRTSLSAVLLAALLGLPLGASLALFRFPGRRVLTILVSALMGLPPVVVGLALYLILSRSGPLGVLELLFTPTAMIVAQTVLVLPIIAALTRQVVEDLLGEYHELFLSLGVSRRRALVTLLYDGRFRLVPVLLAGLGRAISEVGAVMIVGGNIDHATRIMTTAIALETSRGDLSLALGLGIVLLLLTLVVNTIVFLVREVADHPRAGTAALGSER